MLLRLSRLSEATSLLWCRKEETPTVAVKSGLVGAIKEGPERCS